MKILFLTFYFEPDLCAGSFRNTALAKKISIILSEKVEIDVVTTIPNRYKSFKKDAESEQGSGNLTIHRINIPSHKNNFAGQIRSFQSYYVNAMKLAGAKKFDIVFASSSRLFTAFLGSRIAARYKLPLYLDIRDIFVDTISDVLKNQLLKSFMIPVLKLTENYTFRRADHINLVSRGFEDYFKKFHPKSLSFFTNGIDDEFLNLGNFIRPERSYFTILYAGNIGEGQGLDKIVPEAAALLGSEYRFIIIGDGGTRRKLEEEISKRKLTNVELLLPIERSQLLEYYNNADFLLIHLNDYNAFKKVLPSKVFEYGAFDKPIIAGLSGYSRMFVEENLENCVLFNPGDACNMVDKLLKFNYRNVRRHKFIDTFKRDAIMGKMASSIIDLYNRRSHSN